MPGLMARACRVNNGKRAKQYQHAAAEVVARHRVGGKKSPSAYGMRPSVRMPSVVSSSGPDDPEAFGHAGYGAWKALSGRVMTMNSVIFSSSSRVSK